jgi:ubiquinone/menaquinone biosynthesis C-methylase UbiE
MAYESVQREYSKLAPRYDTRWRTYLEASIRETLAHLCIGQSARILDVGCGTGELLRALALAAPGCHLTGIDISPEMLGIARRKLDRCVELKEGQAEALPFGDAAFDCVVSTNVFHFIRRPISALQETLRVLRPSGRVVITDWCDDYLACRVCDRFLRVVGRADGRIYGSEACRLLLAEACFQDVSVQRYKISWLWGMMTATAKKEALSR